MKNKKNFNFLLNGFFKSLVINILRLIYPNFITSKFYNFLLKVNKSKVNKLLTMQSLPNYGSIEKGQLVLYGEIFTKNTIQSFKSFSSIAKGKKSSKYIHNFSWLPDLKAVNTIPAQEKAVFLIESWMAQCKNTDKIAWGAYTSSERLLNIAYNYNFISSYNNVVFHHNLYKSIIKQVNHIYNYSFSVKPNQELPFLVNIAIINHFIVNKDLFNKTINLIIKYLENNMLSDGFFPNRNAVYSVNTLYSLIILEEIYTSCKMNFPAELRSAIDKIALTIKSIRHPDGSLPVFNGSYEIEKNKIDLILLKSDIGNTHEISNIRYGGYATILTNNVFVITDTGYKNANTKYKFNSLLSSEVSINGFRLIVNRGYLIENQKPSWLSYKRDVHSGVYFKNHKGKDIKLDIKQNEDIKTKVYNNNNKQTISCNYTGLHNTYGITYSREIITESEDSLLFDELITKTGHKNKIGRFGIRINLHPNIKILDHKKNEALIEIPDKSTLVIKADKKFNIKETTYYGQHYGSKIKCCYLDIPLEFTKNSVNVLWGIKFVKKI